MAKKLSDIYFLLDLNYTLVANSIELRGKSEAFRFQNEQYREWMLDVLRATEPAGILLVTIRHKDQEAKTLQRINKLLNWQPDEAFFCDRPATPPAWKKYVCQRSIFPKYGADPSKYLFVESNLDTQKMYHQLGIQGFKVHGLRKDDSYAEPIKRKMQQRLF